MARSREQRGREPGDRRAASVAGPAVPSPVEMVLAMQRGAGNAAVSRALIARDIDEGKLVEAVDALPDIVKKGGGTVPLANEDQKRHFMRAGKEKFGSYDGTVAHFKQIRAANVPGGIYLHDTAAGRLEKVAAEMGPDMPGGGGGFQLRKAFDASVHYSRKSHHTLGLAVDYDDKDMIRMGGPARTNEKGEQVEGRHLVDLIELVTGQPAHADLEQAGKDRRATVKAMGAATAAGQDPAAVPGGQAMLTQIDAETARLAAASKAFQDSLGTAGKDLIELRRRYHDALDKKTGRRDPKEVEKIMAEVPAVVKPWTDKVDGAIATIESEASAAGVDPQKIPDDGALAAMAREHAEIAAAARKVAPGADAPKLSAWEAKLKLTPAPDATPDARVAAVAAAADAAAAKLRALAGLGPKVKRYRELRTMLVTDKTFLFGGGPGKASVDPSMGQLVESGFFTPGKPGKGQGDVGNFDSKFIQTMAKHGFDMGFAWGGVDCDSMHFELVTDLLG